MRVLSRPLMLLLLMALPSVALAGPAGLAEPGPRDEATSGEALKRAAQAFKAKDFQAACDAGKQAYAAGGGADALETVAVAALRLGHAALAFQCYEAIAADKTAGAGVAGRARNQLNALGAQTGTVEVKSEPQGAKISVGGIFAGTTPFAPLKILAGKAEVEAVFGDGTKKSEQLTIAAGKSQTVSFAGPQATPVAAPLPVPVVVPLPLIAAPVIVAVPVPVALPPPPAVEPPTPPPVKPSVTPSGGAISASLAALPVPKNPVMAGMHRLALQLGSGLRSADPTGLRRVAVMPFAATTQAKDIEALGNLSADLLSGRLVIQPGILQVERSRLDRVVGEVRRAEGGTVSNDGAVSAGKLIGANCVVLGSIGDAGSDYLVTARIVDVESGKVLMAADESIARAGLIALNADAVEVKSPLGAMLRSTAVPGWGQIYNGDTFRGVGYMVGAVAFAGTAVASGVAASQAADEYTGNSKEAVGRRADANTNYQRTNIALAGLGLVWLVSMADAYITGKDARIVNLPDESPSP
ncbi:MAG: hypothetical protein EXR76_06655 [Myxococcales bacterium]|nr:hypothetical protein [Myxococcales bacterium]